MSLMTLIFIAIVVLGWRLRKDNAKRNELLEQISSQQMARKQSLSHQAKPKPVVKKTRPTVVLTKLPPRRKSKKLSKNS